MVKKHRISLSNDLRNAMYSCIEIVNGPVYIYTCNVI